MDVGDLETAQKPLVAVPVSRRRSHYSAPTGWLSQLQSNGWMPGGALRAPSLSGRVPRNPTRPRRGSTCPQALPAVWLAEVASQLSGTEAREVISWLPDVVPCRRAKRACADAGLETQRPQRWYCTWPVFAGLCNLSTWPFLTSGH